MSPLNSLSTTAKYTALTVVTPLLFTKYIADNVLLSIGLKSQNDFKLFLSDFRTESRLAGCP